MFPKIATRLIGARQALNVALVRNIGSTSVVLSKLDPIQELYLQKVREYYKKKSASATGLVDSSPEAQKYLKDEIEKISKQFGASASAEFPALSFSEPKLDAVAADKLEAKHF